MFRKNNKMIKKHKRRAMTSEDASRIKIQGHTDEKIFSKLIGGKTKIGTGKQDVVDKNSGIHSVKGGEKKWQIFLYGRNRFDSDKKIPGAKLFIKCIDAFPENWEKYKKDKLKYKKLLQPAMRNLKDFLFKPNNKKKFFQKAFFNNEVDYLTIKNGAIFYVFDDEDVVSVLNKETIVENSKARMLGQNDDLKVIFKIFSRSTKKTIGEIELRTDRAEKFKLVKFWMLRDKTFDLLKSKIIPQKQVYKNVFALGKAINKFEAK